MITCNHIKMERSPLRGGSEKWQEEKEEWTGNQPCGIFLVFSTSPNYSHKVCKQTFCRQDKHYKQSIYVRLSVLFLFSPFLFGVTHLINCLVYVRWLYWLGCGCNIGCLLFFLSLFPHNCHCWTLHGSCINWPDM